MIYWLSDYLMLIDSSFAVLQYITVRAAFSVITALIVSLIFGPIIIDRLNVAQVGQVVRTDGPQTHFEKAGTPTMGGVLILL
ncbi:MAG: phospho-N-acetylmuramoyl-pentapeptide-transferase, partial [Gammaproteobacteria bacterium]|nr:phospho-N-acetylmuramoyl-pentapeptide-transferase [Gammaproteobacteria bacterium]